MRRYIVLFLALFLSNCAFAQLELIKDSFHQIDGFDNNKSDDPNFAVILIKTVNLSDAQCKELVFEADDKKLTNIEYNADGIWVYIRYYSNFIKVSHPKYGHDEFGFKGDLDINSGYEITLVNHAEPEVEEQTEEKVENVEIQKTTVPPVTQNTVKFFTLNGAVNSYGDFSCGLTVGSHKAMGWFASVMTNFTFTGLSSDYECGNNLLVGHYYPDYSGDEYHASLSIMGGFIYKIKEQMALRAGVGYGARNTVYKTTDNKLVKNTDVSTSGIDLSLGAQYEYDKYIVSLDVVTTNFNVFELRIGIGLGLIK